MSKKRATIEVQFNWIFVMIAGALILVFFFGIVQKQRQMSQAKIANSLLTNIESIATGAGVAKGTVQEVDLPNIGINFGCTEECLCTYSIENIRKEYNDKVIFAPKLVKASKIIFWTLDWKVPFRATNFIFATTANDKYFFVYDNPGSSLLRTINKSLPAQVNAQFVHFGQYSGLRNENYNSAKFIFVDTTSAIPANLGVDRSFRKADVSGLYINNAGDAVFYDKVSKRELVFQKKQSSYFGEPAIYGAIFASNSNSYECNIISALGRLGNILDLYIARTDILDMENNVKNFCIRGYPIRDLEQLKGGADTASKDLSKLKMLSSAVAAINTQNEGLLRAGCPLLY